MSTLPFWYAAISMISRLAGAVFLPAAGLRNGMSVSNVGSIGYYWSSTPNGTSSAYRLYFISSSVSPYSNNRKYGYSVRLVQDL